MKTIIPVLSLILLLGACTEPKMRLKAPEPSLEKTEAGNEKTDTLNTDTGKLALKN